MGWITALKAGLAAALIVAVYYVGDSAGANRVIARDAKADAKAASDLELAQVALNFNQDKAAAREGARSASMKEIIREEPTIISRPIYQQHCADADGVRAIDRARQTAIDVAGGPFASPNATEGAGVPAER